MPLGWVGMFFLAIALTLAAALPGLAWLGYLSDGAIFDGGQP